MNSLIRFNLLKSDPQQNQMLAALPEYEWSRWLPHLELVDLPLGTVLCESSSRVDFVYFPTTAVISLLCTTAEGDTSEIAVIGNDGVVGICMIMGGYTMLNQAVVQSAGQAYELRASVVKADVDRAGLALHLLLRYAQSLITQVSQMAVCNRHHDIDQRLARRLLTALDSSTRDEFAMTQEGVASLLGVRREGVTAAALKLQHDGVIRYRHGHIRVLDRNRLEKRTCECYAAVATEHARLLPRVAEVRLEATMPKALAMPISSLRAVMCKGLPKHRQRSAMQIGRTSP